MSGETDLQSQIRLAVGLNPTVRLWRNNSGLLYDRTGRPVRYGVAQPGGSDLIGLKQVTITPDMVGKSLAVFVAAEVKRPDWKPRNAEDRKRWEDQKKFIAFVNDFGGIAGVVRSPEDAVRLVSEELP